MSLQSLLNAWVVFLWAGAACLFAVVVLLCATMLSQWRARRRAQVEESFDPVRPLGGRARR